MAGRQPAPLLQRRILVRTNRHVRVSLTTVLPGKSMSQRCEICGKRPMAGNNVSHSKVHTKRRFMPNLHAAHILREGRLQKARVCTRCLRTQAKAAR